MRSVEEKYHPAMSITSQEEADAYFEQCVQETMAWDFPVVALSRMEAERIERKNLYYFSKGYSLTVQARIVSLFCAGS